MRKSFLFCFLCLSTVSIAQQWTGSTNLTNNLNRSGDITVVHGYPSRISIGPAWSASPIWGQSYVGFNLRLEPTNPSQWSYLNDGATNSSVVMYNSVNCLFFHQK